MNSLQKDQLQQLVKQTKADDLLSKSVTRELIKNGFAREVGLGQYVITGAGMGKLNSETSRFDLLLSVGLDRSVAYDLAEDKNWDAMVTLLQIAEKRECSIHSIANAASKLSKDPVFREKVPRMRHDLGGFGFFQARGEW